MACCRSHPPSCELCTGATRCPRPAAAQAACYRYLDGMEPLLERLAAAGAEVHAFSNYPAWWQLVEGKLALSRYLRWTFVSRHRPMRVGAACSPAWPQCAGGPRRAARLLALLSPVHCWPPACRILLPC